MAKLFRQKSSISGLVTDLLNINTAISNEVTRATDEEIRIEGLITAEVSRATAAEAQIASDLSAEVTRATTAEGTLQANIDAEVTRATTAEGTLQANIDAEVTRATTAEGLIQSNLDAEITRATTAEGLLQGEIDALESLVDSLGNVFNYIGAITAGADEASAFDMATLPAGGKDAGDYYKVTTAGFVKVGEGTPFYANINDGLVWNTLGGVDKIDNTDSVVFGTTDFITVDGSTDTGFTVDIADTFKTRMSTAEADILAEVTRATTAEGTLQANIDAEVTRATTAEGVLQANIDAEVTRATEAEATKLAIASNLSDLADIAVARTNLDVYSKAEVDSAIAGQSNKTKNDTAVIASGKITFSVAPVGGVDGIAFGIIRIFGVDGTNPMAYDEVQVSLDGTDATGKTFIVASDIAGEYDGKSASAFVSYNPAA